MGLASRGDAGLNAMPTVLLAGTLDTKGAEYAFVRERLKQRGVRTLVMDLGVLGADRKSVV